MFDIDFSSAHPIPLGQVEPWTEIVQRFFTGESTSIDNLTWPTSDIVLTRYPAGPDTNQDHSVDHGRSIAVACLSGSSWFRLIDAPLDHGCPPMLRCLASNTQVQTPVGTTAVGDLRVGDEVLGQDGRAALVTAVRDAEIGPLYEVKYFAFDSANQKRETSSLRCTPDHILMMTVSGTRPILTLDKKGGVKRRLDWRSWCHSSSSKSEVFAGNEEIAELEEEARYARRQPDGFANLGQLHMGEHVHTGRGHEPNRLQEHLVGDGHDDDEAPTEIDWDFHLRPAANQPSIDSHLPLPALATPASTPETTMYQAAASPDSAYNSSSDSDYLPSSPSDSISSLPDEEIQSWLSSTDILFKLEILRTRLALARRCQCGVFRRVSINFPTEAAADLVFRVLMSDKYYLIDPLMVRDNEHFQVTAQQYAENKHFSNTKAFARLFRLRPPVSAPSSTTLPIDPYLFGMWLGDGSKKDFAIASSAPETLYAMQRAVSLANRHRPQDAAPLVVTSHMTTRKGDLVMGGPHTANKDCYLHSISSSYQRAEGRYWNPFRDFLRDSNLLHDKSAGIPECVMNASVEARCAVLAGLIESDGSYTPSVDRYRLDQSTQEHHKIVHDMARLALSVGIYVSGPIELKRDARGSSDEIRLRIDLSGPNLDKIQPYLTMAKKRRHAPVQSRTRDARGISTITTLSEPGEFRGVEVSGGTMLLADGLVVHNCGLNTCPIGIVSEIPELREKFAGQPEALINTFYHLAEELRSIMAKLGLRSVESMVGRSDLLRVRTAAED